MCALTRVMAEARQPGWRRVEELLLFNSSSMKKCLAFLGAVVLAHWVVAVECALPGGSADPPKRLSSSERNELIRRAQVWKATDVARMNLSTGPQLKGAFAPGQTVNCDYVNERLGGHTPKFACAIAPDDKVKVRYGRDNGEIFAGVAATRLMWALGFGADALYPVHVICRGCPPEIAAEGKEQSGQVLFDIAAIERKMPGHELDAAGTGSGWSWPELDLVDQRAGGAPLEQRDALKLLAVFLQHTDNKAEQQRLMCLDPKGNKAGAGCTTPFMMIHDVGLTFGSADLLNRNPQASVNFERWARTAIWRDATHCVGNLSESQTGTLSHPLISEGGRSFLAKLLAQLSDRQLQDLFMVSRFGERFLPKGTGGAPVAAWVDAFKHKRDEIAGTTCP